MKAWPAMSAQIGGSIGYVEYAYAKQNKLAHVKLVNNDRPDRGADRGGLPSAAAGADWAAAANNGFCVILVDQPGAQSWPITATTYILVYKNPPDQAATADTLKFFQWGFEKGDQLALGLDYVPLPEAGDQVDHRQLEGHSGLRNVTFLPRGDPTPRAASGRPFFGGACESHSRRLIDAGAGPCWGASRGTHRGVRAHRARDEARGITQRPN